MLSSFFSSLPSLSLAMPTAVSQSFTQALCAAPDGAGASFAPAAGFFAGAAGAFSGAFLAGGAGGGAWATALPAQPIANANATAPACRMRPAAAGCNVQCAILLSTFPCEAGLAQPRAPKNELSALHRAWPALM